MFATYLQKVFDAASFQKVRMQKIPNLRKKQQFFYNSVIADQTFVEELARGSIEMYSNTVRLLHCIVHTCYISNIKASLKIYRCASCGHFIR